MLPWKLNPFFCYTVLVDSLVPSQMFCITSNQRSVVREQAGNYTSLHKNVYNMFYMQKFSFLLIDNGDIKIFNDNGLRECETPILFCREKDLRTKK